MDRKQLREHEKEILLGLVDFYYQSGHTLQAYMHPETGGIYENKLGHRLGYEVTSENLPGPEFQAAAQMLESDGLVKRLKREPDSPLLGIWPTRKGLDKAEYLRAGPLRRIYYLARDNAYLVVVAAITAAATTVVTLLISSLFGLFGLGK